MLFNNRYSLKYSTLTWDITLNLELQTISQLA